tara:strand:+ start:102 stop:668 length:567 start_codon:yes stop_codon:yes gene_type:complete
MKKLLAIIILSLCFITPSQANDIRDFQIEGMSIGDSLLDNFSEKQIKNTKIINYKDNRYKFAYLNKDNSIYAVLQIGFKTNDKNYKIELINGVIDFKNNVDECWNKQDKISNEIDYLFPNNKKEDSGKITQYPEDDPDGVVARFITYYFDSGEQISVYCNDYSKKSGLFDNLKVQIISKKMSDYLQTK